MDFKNEPLISVIIPVYNVAQFLDKCLTSIINQTYKNLEIICINDGSKDNSLDILQKYACKDTRIRVVNQENKGLGAARNVGLGIASGEFVSFIDSDDWVDTKLYELCAEKIKDDVDVIAFGAKTVNLKNNKIYKGQYSSRSFKNNFSYSNVFNIFPVAWNKIYRLDFLKKNALVFETPKTGEDQTFFVKVVLNAKKIEILKKDLYYYIKYRNGALSNRKDSKDLSTIKNTRSVVEYLKNHNCDNKLKNKIITRFLLKVLSWFSKIDKEERAEAYQEINSLFGFVTDNIGNSWWSNYKLKENSSYINIKLEYFSSVVKAFAKNNAK